MLVVGLLAAALGACPGELGTAVSGVQQGTVCAIGDLPSPMTVDALCSAATDENRCCRISSAILPYMSRCFPTYTAGFPYSCDEKPPTENPIHTYSNEQHTDWSMRCPGDTSATTSEQPTTAAEISCTSDLRGVSQGEARGTFCDLDATLTQLRELSANALVDAICSAVTDENRCCFINTANDPASSCWPSDDGFGTAYRCDEEIFRHDFDNENWGVGTAWSVCCPGGPCPTKDTTSSTSTTSNEPVTNVLWTWEEGGCNIPNYPYRGTSLTKGTVCCEEPAVYSQCYYNPLKPCMVSSDTHRCCVFEDEMGGCLNLGLDMCNAENFDEAETVEWCTEVEGNTKDTLPPAAIAGIVVGSLVLIAFAAYVYLT